MLLCTLLIGGCGFQLRGSQAISAGTDQLYIDGPTNLRRELEIFLDGSDTRLLRTSKGANVILNLSNERYDRRVLTVDPDTGKEREFEIAYSIDVDARTAEGKSLVQRHTLTVLRDFVLDRDALLGTSREEAVLLDEMLQDAAQQILLQLRSAVSS